MNVQRDVGPYSTPVAAETEEASKYTHNLLTDKMLNVNDILPAPGPVVISSLPSFYDITITWNEPDIPNGNITHYEVYYGRRHFKPSAIKTTTGLDTNFTTPGHLESGTEMFFTVTAYTRVGGGEPVTVIVSTLIRPCKHIIIIVGAICIYVAAVEGVTVTSLTHTSVNVSWNAVIIPDFPIDSYTVVYSPVSESDRRQDGEMTAVFPGSVTSGVITDLEASSHLPVPSVCYCHSQWCVCGGRVE